MTEPFLRRLELFNFKAFDRFTLGFEGSSFIVGPNNAGKSTLIAAIRTCALMRRFAARRNPTEVMRYRDEEFYAYPVHSGQFALCGRESAP
jgi:recombinational DNA repair ATPase RecF